jgi:hypothetical protein
MSNDTQSTKENFLSVIDLNSTMINSLENYKIRPDDDIPPPQPCIEILSENSSSILGTLGNFSLVIGKAKSKKTFLMSLVVSASTKNGILYEKMKATFPLDQNQILYFDTEQGKHHVKKHLDNICKLSDNTNPENLHVYGLRPMSPMERLQKIESAILTKENLGLVIIDGIKDLVTSINDEEQASMISTKLLKWSGEKNIHIITVLHQNKGDNNARGHLGTELVNKAETVLSITKLSGNSHTSIVESEFCRGKEPEPFAFEINSEGLPVIVDTWMKPESRKSKVDTLSDANLYRMMLECFTSSDVLSYSDLLIQTKIAFKKLHHDTLGDNKAKEIIMTSRNKGLVVQNGHKQPYRIGNQN